MNISVEVRVKWSIWVSLTSAEIRLRPSRLVKISRAPSCLTLKPSGAGEVTRMASSAMEPRIVGECTPQQTRWQTCPPRCLSGLGTNPQLPARALRPVSSPTELLPHAHLPSQVVRRARLHATLATPSQGPDPAAPVLSRTRPLALPTRALPRHPRAMTGVTETFTASTAALLGGTRGRVRAHAIQDTVEQAARLRTRALPPQPRARMGATAASTASTVALSATPLARARAPHATPDTVVPVA